ncbi:protein KIBRA [Crotalus adamanteus]|uniref:Protein KIBRA n=1 Tax=Crotalus adamanteus TaxID=8729 RepID=A0AAW1BIM1_CROAD
MARLSEKDRRTAASQPSSPGLSRVACNIQKALLPPHALLLLTPCAAEDARLPPGRLPDSGFLVRCDPSPQPAMPAAGLGGGLLNPLHGVAAAASSLGPSPLLCLLLGKMPQQELPLPEDWEEARDYIDHATKTTSWVDPQDSIRQAERAWGGLHEVKPAANLREMPVAAGCFLAAGPGSLTSAFHGGPRLVCCNQWQAERARDGLHEGRTAANLWEMPVAAGCFLATGLGSLASAFHGGPRLVCCDQWQAERARGGLHEGRPAANLREMPVAAGCFVAAGPGSGLGLPRWPPACPLRSVAGGEGAGRAARGEAGCKFTGNASGRRVFCSCWAGLFGLGLPRWPPVCLLRSVAGGEGVGRAA